jgi:hypothetical protein
VNVGCLMHLIHHFFLFIILEGIKSRMFKVNFAMICNKNILMVLKPLIYKMKRILTKS